MQLASPSSESLKLNRPPSSALETFVLFLQFLFLVYITRIYCLFRLYALCVEGRANDTLCVSDREPVQQILVLKTYPKLLARSISLDSIYKRSKIRTKTHQFSDNPALACLFSSDYTVHCRYSIDYLHKQTMGPPGYFWAFLIYLRLFIAVIVLFQSHSYYA